MTRSWDANARIRSLEWSQGDLIMRASRFVVLVAIALVACGAVTLAQLQSPAEAKWGPAPPMLPAGAQIAVLSGDPSKPAPYSVRLRFPAGYKIPAHSHPTDENVVVTTGGLYIGMGDKLDPAGGKMIGAGGYGLAPSGMNHYAYTKAATTIVLYGQGPVEFKYVNPADDPRNKKGK
jgi:hypothetical protein